MAVVKADFLSRKENDDYFRIEDDQGNEVATVSALIGEGTNNIAEYRAAIEGLRKAKSLGATDIELRMDSQLIVRQINGVYKVKNVMMKVLHAEAIDLLESFDKYAVVHVPREDNARADELANLAYDTLGG